MKDIVIIQKEAFEWTVRNFPNQSSEDPFEGMIEELGEYCHADLKERQGIRKKDYKALRIDAIGDFAIYLLNYLSLKNFSLKSDIYRTAISYYDSRTYNYILDGMSTEEIHSLCRIKILKDLYDLRIEFSRPNQISLQPLYSLLINLMVLSNVNDSNLLKILNDTWESVSKRDWIKYPKTGLPDKSELEKAQEITSYIGAAVHKDLSDLLGLSD